MASRFDATPATAKRTAVQAQLIAAAHDMLEEGAGYTELSIERITRRAGLSRTAFYFYFADKGELLLALVEDVAAQFFGQADGWFSGDIEIRDSLANIVSLYDEHGAVIAIMIQATSSDEQAARLWRTLIGRFIDATRARIERDQAAGKALQGSAGTIAFSLCWMTERALYEHYVAPGDHGRDELVDSMTAIWQRSIYG
jgi:TetR/AcrR family transcriptional regulator, ethionamide resistance regulator